MKHAGPEALRALEALLTQVRGLPGLVERKPGIFYRRGAAWLHFHEDPAGLFADAKLGGPEFERLRVSTAPEQQQLVEALRRSLEAKEG